MNQTLVPNYCRPPPERQPMSSMLLSSVLQGQGLERRHRIPQRPPQLLAALQVTDGQKLRLIVREELEHLRELVSSGKAECSESLPRNALVGHSLVRGLRNVRRKLRRTAMQRSTPHSLADHPRPLKDPRCHLAHVLQNRPRDRSISKRQRELVAPIRLLIQRKERREVLDKAARVQKSHRQTLEKRVRTILGIKMRNFHASGRVVHQHLRVRHLRVRGGLLQCRHHDVLHTIHTLQSIRTILVLLHLLVRVHTFPEVGHHESAVTAAESRLQGPLVIKVGLAHLDLRQSRQHLRLIRARVAGDSHNRHALGDQSSDNSPTLLTSCSQNGNSRWRTYLNASTHDRKRYSTAD
mmetsp:Transcript_90282/g.206443  ORF Transcript_90282/g.206443 Transcript_90282/m.206443 type:complete len:352 (-) Transcript_90282:3-1058(-)